MLKVGLIGLPSSHMSDPDVSSITLSLTAKSRPTTDYIMV
jgi:hypothetical protein